MIAEGNISKMRVELEHPVHYSLQLSDEVKVDMNDLIGKEISLAFNGVINCVNCGRVTKKSFAQGSCYPCFINSPNNAECIIRPELCRAHLGEGRDPEWEERNHNQPHIVYMAIGAGIKVGVTRETQIPTRWIDQGAWKAVRLARTPNRYQAGVIEVDMKSHVSDKTHWMKMLKNELAEDLDVIKVKEELLQIMNDKYNDFHSEDNEIIEINYPVLEFPTKVKSHNLDKLPLLKGKLMGIKGQYLIFDGGIVINLRKYSGYHIEITA
ncbi:DUF2797 domain-containing protein [Vicingaceae bacterium]|nr:DUF2797 domain-containing protein [Vicingaceae bacterium]